MEAVMIHEKPFKCPQCETRFKSTKYINRHIGQQHSDQPTKLMCWFCRKTYQNKANYKVHWNKTHKHEYLLYLKPKEVNIIVIPPVSQLSEMNISKKVADVNVKVNIITHRMYGNPYNKVPFAISTLERTQLVNLIVMQFF